MWVSPILRRGALTLPLVLLGACALASSASAIGQIGFSGPLHHGESGVRGAALGDFDGDGALDLAGVTTLPDDRIAVLLGDGAGGFGTEATYPAGMSV